MSVRRAQAEINSAEFAEWIAFHSTEPFASERIENMLCIIATIFANAHIGKNTRPYKPEDFKPDYKKKSADTAISMETKLRAMFKNGNN